MNIHYRAATLEDAAAIANVEVTSMQVANREFMPAVHLEKMDRLSSAERWKNALPSTEEQVPDQVAPDHIVVVAVHEKTVIGYVGAGKTNDKDVGFISSLFILSEYWGVGIGKVLMAEAMDIFREFKCHSAILCAYCDNPRARRFYERLGWTLTGKTYTQEIEGIKLEMVYYGRTVEK